MQEIDNDPMIILYKGKSSSLSKTSSCDEKENNIEQRLLLPFELLSKLGTTRCVYRKNIINKHVSSETYECISPHTHTHNNQIYIILQNHKVKLKLYQNFI